MLPIKAPTSLVEVLREVCINQFDFSGFAGLTFVVLDKRRSWERLKDLCGLLNMDVSTLLWCEKSYGLCSTRLPTRVVQLDLKFIGQIRRSSNFPLLRVSEFGPH